MTATSDPAIEPLPPYARARDALAEAVAALRQPKRELVSETALRRSVFDAGQWVPWRWDVAPYMREPGDMVTSRRFDSVALVGPARCSKSEGLVMNPLAHAILAQPRRVAVFSPSQAAAERWSYDALEPMIAASQELAARRRSGRGNDNVHSKRFRGGATLSIDWPVKPALAQRSLDLVIGTDYDAFDADIGGDGGAFPLMRKRTESAGSRGMTVVESSPRRPILDETWTRKTPHEAPPAAGIVAIYNAGSRGRLYWTCPDCAGLFVPEFDLLSWPEEGSIADRAALVTMACPHCGSVIGPKARPGLNRGAVWLHEGEAGEVMPIGDLNRRVDTASYWVPGPAAALAPWSRLVARLLEAEAEFAATGDENGLMAVHNTELGLPYLPRSLDAEAALSAETLRRAAPALTWRAAPAGTAFLTAAVDVQKGRFVVQIEAWALDLSRVLIDRFDLIAPPEGAPDPEGRAIDPARVAEDWAALDALFERAYPVEGADHALVPVTVISDSQGEPGVAANAYGYYRRCRREFPGRFRLVRGRQGYDRPRAKVSRPETAHAGKAFVARDIRLVWAATDRLKDEVAASLLRGPGGARKLSVPAAAPPAVFEEYAAERRGPKGWEKRPGVRRNEALDLSVYALAAAIVIEAEAIDRANPPAWARPDGSNSMARALATALPAVAGAASQAPAPAPQPTRPGFVVRRSNPKGARPWRGR